MKLLMSYVKLIWKKNKVNYLTAILSIFGTYFIITLLIVYIDNALILSLRSDGFQFRYLYISIRTVFLIAGVSFVINQYYTIMKSGFRDYCILKALGATGKNIRTLFLLQELLLILITVPIGVSGGCVLNAMILSYLGSYSLNSGSTKWVASADTFCIMAGAACCFILSIGAYLYTGVRKTSITALLSENPVINKEEGTI